MIWVTTLYDMADKSLIMTNNSLVSNGSYLLRFLLLFCILTSSMVSQAKDIPTLDRLDEVIRTRTKYEDGKRSDIMKARINFERAASDSDRYNALRGLYEAYRSFRIDSAMIFARQRLEIARNLGVPAKIASATINLAEAASRSGAVDAAIHILDTLDNKSLQSYHLKYKNGVYREAYRTKADNAVLKSEREEALAKLKLLTDSALNESPSDSRGHYTLTAEKLCDAGLFTEAVATIEEASRKFDFSEDAAMLSTMGEIYIKANEPVKAKECLAKSSILDLTSGTKEYKSLISLATILLEEGDIDRAFEYINCAFQDAEFSRASLRTTEIMKRMPLIDKAFHETQKKVVTRTRLFLIIAGVMVLCLSLVVAWYIKALHTKRRMLRTIREINSNLEQTNDALAQANSLKLHYINTLMKANSEYISRLKAFRLKVFRFMKTGQYDKALDLVDKNRNESRDISAFQDLFDEAFLSMFPDFIEKVNRFTKERIVLKDPSRLTPELRVIAMMKLKMGTTEEISGVMHYSNQTVYNLRTSIRNLLIIPWEEFEKEVETI